MIYSGIDDIKSIYLHTKKGAKYTMEMFKQLFDWKGRYYYYSWLVVFFYPLETEIG